MSQCWRIVSSQGRGRSSGSGRGWGLREDHMSDVIAHRGVKEHTTMLHNQLLELSIGDREGA